MGIDNIFAHRVRVHRGVSAAISAVHGMWITCASIWSESSFLRKTDSLPWAYV